MPKIDIPVKKLIELRPADWARYVQPGCREEWVTKFKTNYTPKKESRLDSVLEITDPGGSYLLNFEPMGYRDNALPARMLRYRSDIWEATLTVGAIYDKEGNGHGITHIPGVGQGRDGGG